MELKDVFRGRWLLAIFIVPILFEVAAVSAFLANAPSRYQANAVVSVRELSVPSGSSTAALIDDFDSALGGPRTGQAVADAEGRSEPSGSIAARAVGNGADVIVSFESDSAANALDGLEAGVREALLILTESELRQAERRFVSSRSVAAEATDELQELEESVGAANLSEEVARRSADILTLRNQIASNVGTQFETALEEVLQEKVDELRSIELQLLPWEEGRSRFNRALEVEAQAALDVAQAEQIVADIRTGTVLRTPQIAEVGPLMELLRVAIGAGLAAVGLVVAAALFFGGRRKGAAEPVADDGYDAGPLDTVSANGNGDGFDEVYDDEADVVVAGASTGSTSGRKGR